MGCQVGARRRAVPKWAGGGAPTALGVPPQQPQSFIVSAARAFRAVRHAFQSLGGNLGSGLWAWARLGCLGGLGGWGQRQRQRRHAKAQQRRAVRFGFVCFLLFAFFFSFLLLVNWLVRSFARSMIGWLVGWFGTQWRIQLVPKFASITPLLHGRLRLSHQQRFSTSHSCLQSLTFFSCSGQSSCHGCRPPLPSHISASLSQKGIMLSQLEHL